MSKIIITGKTEDKENFADYIIQSEISDRDRAKFRIIQNFIVHIYKNDEYLNEEKELIKLKGLL